MYRPPRFPVPERFWHRSPEFVRQVAEQAGFVCRKSGRGKDSEIWAKPGDAGFWVIRLDSQGHGRWHHGARPHYHKNWVPAHLFEAYLRRFVPEALAYDDFGALLGEVTMNHPEHLARAQHIPR